MNATEMRTELLAEHMQLRGLIEESRVAIARVPVGQPEDDDGPAACLSRLASALRAHNLREEHLLKGVLVGVDAWGPVRAELMDERHATEHAQLHAALLDTTIDPRQVRDLLDRLVKHMEFEERTFLGEDVLRDDTIVIDSFGG